MKIVPLVMYKDGVRTVVGKAEVRDDGQDLVVEATIAAEHTAVLGVDVGGFSIRSQEFPSENILTVSEKHAAKYGIPTATPESIAAWTEVVESYSKLGDERA